MRDLATEYRRCVQVERSIDCANRKTVRANTSTVDKMYTLVARAESEGESTRKALIALLERHAAQSDQVPATNQSVEGVIVQRCEEGQRLFSLSCWPLLHACARASETAHR